MDSELRLIPHEKPWVADAFGLLSSLNPQSLLGSNTIAFNLCFQSMLVLRAQYLLPQTTVNRDSAQKSYVLQIALAPLSDAIRYTP